MAKGTVPVSSRRRPAARRAAAAPRPAKVATAPGPAVTWDRARIQTALNHLDDGFSVFDADLRLVAWNDRFFELTDIPAARFARVGKPFADFMRFNAERGEYGPGDPEKLVTERVAVARAFVPHSFERTRPNGQVLEIRGNPLPDGGFVTIYKDITERKRAERNLKESHDLLEGRVKRRTAELQALNDRLMKETAERERALAALHESQEWVRLFADTVPALIGYVDGRQRYRFANRIYQEWLGLSPEKIIGRTVRQVLGDEVYRGHRQHMAAALTGQASSREFTLRRADGRDVQVVASFIPHVGEGGKVNGYFVLGQDVSEQRQAEAALRQAQKMEAIGQLTGGLAHDFNNLLTVIIGNLAVLREQTGDEGISSLLDSALDAARRGANVVKRLLAFARRHPLQPKRVDAAALVAGMEDLLRRTLGARIAIEIRGDGRRLPVRVDPHQLENAILNLAINGRDAMADGGVLTIELGRCRFGGETGRRGPLAPGRYAVIAVRDNGAGMPREVLERAFEPFFTTKRRSGGSGLGLSMVYGFARQSEGHAEIASAPGAGTVVTLYLPMAEGRDETARRRRPAAAVGGSETVLVVEDDGDVRAFAAEALAVLGYRVRQAASGPEALAAVERDGCPDLLLTDIEMPGGLDGLALAREVRRRATTTRVLLVSGFADRALARAGGGDRFDLLEKPFDKAELAARVRQILDAPAA